MDPPRCQHPALELKVAAGSHSGLSNNQNARLAATAYSSLRYDETHRDVGDIPRGPAIYAMGGGGQPRAWVAYVGDAGNLRQRLGQHFINRDSSVVTGASAAGLNIDHVRYVEWWEDQAFADEDSRRAAELVAFDVLDPVLRSRGNPRQAARELYADRDFHDAMTKVFEAPPVGRLTLPRLPDLIQRLNDLERRISELEGRT